VPPSAGGRCRGRRRQRNPTRGGGRGGDGGHDVPVVSKVRPVVGYQFMLLLFWPLALFRDAPGLAGSELRAD
jgi:hypothetical protein